jgi:hypothetical protein
VAAYNAELDSQFEIHRIEERLQAIDEATQGMFPIPDEYQVLYLIDWTYRWRDSVALRKRMPNDVSN